MKQKTVIVLGMHRSGTSVLARGVKALSVEIGNDLVPTQPDNPLGYWENQVVLKINEGLLDLLSLKWDSLTLIQSERWQEPAIKNLKLEAVKLLRDSFGDMPLWGFKDPRTIRLLPFWLYVFQQLKLDEKYVLAIRNPLSVADSLLKRNGITQEKAHLMWLVHMIPYLLQIKKKPLVVVDYDLLLADPVQQLQRIADRLHLPIDMASIHTNISEYALDFVKKELCHCQYTKQDINLDARIDLISQNAYHWLLQMAEDKIDQDSPEFWSKWEHLWKLLSALKPAYHYIDQIEAGSESLQAQLAVRNAHIRDLENQLTEENQKAHYLTSQVDNLEAQLTEQNNHIRDLENQLIEQNKNISALYTTLSWRITAPLRATKRIIWATVQTSGLQMKALINNFRAPDIRKFVQVIILPIFSKIFYFFKLRIYELSIKVFLRFK